MNSYKLFKVFFNVNQDCSFINKGGNLFINIDKGLFIYNFFNNSINNIIEGEVYCFRLHNNKIIYQLKNGGNLLELETKKIFEGNYYLVRSLIISNDSLLIRGKNSENKKVIYEYNNLDIKESSLNILPDMILYNSHYIYVELNTIFMYNFKNEIIWEISFSELIQSEDATLRSKIIEKFGKLFFIVSGTLFCLNANSGKVEHYFENYLYEIFQDDKQIYTSKFENILCRINPENFEVEEWDVSDLVKKNGFDSIHDHRCTAKNGLFYFTQTLGDNKAKFGVLDFNTKELIYKYEFEPKNGGISSIQVNEDRIFIHTQDNTLHIFEKE